MGLDGAYTVHTEFDINDYSQWLVKTDKCYVFIEHAVFSYTKTQGIYVNGPDAHEYIKYSYVPSDIAEYALVSINDTPSGDGL